MLVKNKINLIGIRKIKLPSEMGSNDLPAMISEPEVMEFHSWCIRRCHYEVVVKKL